MQGRFPPHAVPKEADFVQSAGVQKSQHIFGHGRVGVDGVVWTSPMVPCIKHPHVMRCSVAFAKRLPIVRTAQEAMQNHQVWGGGARFGGEVSRVEGDRSHGSGGVNPTG
jgi:hypothetical protein